MACGCVFGCVRGRGRGSHSSRVRFPWQHHRNRSARPHDHPQPHGCEALVSVVVALGCHDQFGHAQRSPNLFTRQSLPLVSRRHHVPSLFLLSMPHQQNTFQVGQVLSLALTKPRRIHLPSHIHVFYYDKHRRDMLQGVSNLATPSKRQATAHMKYRRACR